MPYYEYHCPSNGRTVEVRHGMNERVETWGALIERTGIDAGDTPAATPVERLLSAPVPLTGDSGTPSFGGCGTGCACAPKA
ncbi:MAG: zinc ribbon domain-containing protein [Gemmatimonadota bacterium]